MYKNNELIRIFVVGDSYTESFQVPRKKSYVQILENKLNASEHRGQVDIIKLARDGFNPAHYPLIINRFADKFQPDLIVLQFWAHSGGDLYSPDIICDYNELNQITRLEVAPKIEDKGKERLRFLINNSALAYHFLRRYKSVLMEMVERFSFHSSKLKRRIQKKNKTRRSVVDMGKRLSFIFDKISSTKSKLVVFYIPEPGIFFNNSISHSSDTLKALQQITNEKSIPLLDLTEIFQKYYSDNSQPLNGFVNTLPGKGHLNSTGHKILANALFEKIKSLQAMKQ